MYLSNVLMYLKAIKTCNHSPIPMQQFILHQLFVLWNIDLAELGLYIFLQTIICDFIVWFKKKILMSTLLSHVVML